MGKKAKKVYNEACDIIHNLLDHVEELEEDQHAIKFLMTQTGLPNKQISLKIDQISNDISDALIFLEDNLKDNLEDNLSLKEKYINASNRVIG